MNRTKALPGKKYLDELLSYNKDTGDIFWLIRPRHHFKTDRGHSLFNNRFAGEIAGTLSTCVNGGTYRVINISGTLYKAHRLIWKLVTGLDPDCIDHIDTDGTNNKLSNLRSVTRGINQKNKTLQSNNTSGINGVYFNKKTNKWTALIRVGRSNKYLGEFEDINKAKEVRKQAEKSRGYHLQHGEERNENN